MPTLDFEFYNSTWEPVKGQLNKKGLQKYKKVKANHRQLFLDQLASSGINLQNGQLIRQFDEYVENGIEFNDVDFIHHALFRHQNNNRPGSRDSSEIQETAYHRIHDFTNFYEFNGTVRNILTRQQGGADRTYSEYQGVAGSLILTNKLFGLTNADYKGINEEGGRVLDFSLDLASDGSRFIQIESKGKSGLDGTLNIPARSIIDKKVDNQGARDILFGVVTEIPFQNEPENAKITLVDPPMDDLELNPLKFQVFRRLDYYSRIFDYFSRSRLALFLDMLTDVVARMDEKDFVSEYVQYISDKIPERRRPFHSSFMYNLSRITLNRNTRRGISFMGLFEQVSEDIIGFYGIKRDLISLLSVPTIENIQRLNFKEEVVVLDPEKSEIRVQRLFSRQAELEPFIEELTFGKIHVYSTGECRAYWRIEKHGGRNQLVPI